MNKLKVFLPLLLFTLYCLLFTSPVYAKEKILKSIPESKKLVAEKDTCVNSVYPETNFGQENKISVGFTSSSNIMFLKFRLEGLSIESFNEDEKAILNLWLEESTGKMKTIETEALLPSADWDEEKLTWNNKPSLYSSEIPADLEATSGAQKIDITNLVKQWLNGEIENTGIAFYYNWEDFSRTYSSRENEKHPPTLIIGREAQAESFPVLALEEKDQKQGVVQAVKTKMEKVRGVKIKKPSLNLNNLITTNNIIPLTGIWTVSIFLLLLKIFREYPL
mgnify:CR=1 FL=1